MGLDRCRRFGPARRGRKQPCAPRSGGARVLGDMCARDSCSSEAASTRRPTHSARCGTRASAHAYSNPGRPAAEGRPRRCGRSIPSLARIEPVEQRLLEPGTVYYFRGQYQEAVAEYAAATSAHQPGPALWAPRGRALADSGKTRRGAAITGARSPWRSAASNRRRRTPAGRAARYYHGRIAEPEQSHRYLERAARRATIRMWPIISRGCRGSGDPASREWVAEAQRSATRRGCAGRSVARGVIDNKAARRP